MTGGSSIWACKGGGDAESGQDAEDQPRVGEQSLIVHHSQSFSLGRCFTRDP